MNPSIRTRYFLFADVRQFSRIGDGELPRFIDSFLGGIASLLDSPPLDSDPPLYANTWGDAFLFVFDSARAAGNAALAIRRWVRDDPIRLGGMPLPLGLRIGMHAGPVFEGTDPISRRPFYLGTHINRAARIEPIAEEGQIFVSREFAALSAFENVTTFRCVAQGFADLPKGGGRIPVYRLEESGAR